MHGALNLDGASPLRMPSAFSGTGSGEEWLVMHGSRTNEIIAQRKTLRTSAVAHCARCPNTHGPVTRRARCRARSERVQRDRVGKFGLCHAWVTIESRSNPKPRRVVRMFSFGDSTVKLAMGPFEISAGERCCTFSEPGE